MGTYHNMKNLCENGSLYQEFKNEIENNMIWNRKTPEITIDNNILNIEIKILYDMTLNANIDSYNSNADRNFECEIFELITYRFIHLNQLLNRLSTSNVAVLEELINFKQIMNNVRDLLRYDESNLIQPFNTLTDKPYNFFIFTKYHFYKNNFEITLYLGIPLYEEMDLVRIFPKPILKKFSPYVLNMEAEYAVLSKNESIFYTYESLSKNCLWQMKKFYCAQPQEKFDCEGRAISGSEIDINCFSRLPSKNIITQVGANSYFLILSPITIHIKCEGWEIIVKIQNNSKILDNFGCSISHANFNYTPFFSKSYEIYVSNDNIDIDCKGNLIELCLSIIFYILSTILVIINAHRYLKSRRNMFKSTEL